MSRQRISVPISDCIDVPGVPERKRRAPRKHEEDDLHMAVAKLLSVCIARPGVASSDGVLWFSVELRGKRSIIEGARNRRRGCIPGVPDICIIWNREYFGIELKAPKGSTSQDQKDLHSEIRKAGGFVSISRSIEDVRALIEFWRIPHKPFNLA